MNSDNLDGMQMCHKKKQVRLHITAVKKHVSPIEFEGIYDSKEKDSENPLQEVQVNHPEYYSSGGIEAIDFIEAHGLNFNRGNVIKYITRAGRKDGEEELTALEKAKGYLDREIERIKKGRAVHNEKT